MLETPVLEGLTLQAFQEALELYAGVLVNENKSQALRRWDELIVKVFSKQFSHSYWMDWALGLPTRQAAPLWNLDVQNYPWVRSEIGISRIPTTVITAIPLGDSGKRHDTVEDMLRIYHFQRRSFQFARTLTQTVGGKLENYGAVFVTSADPSQSRPQRRRKIMETAEQIHRFAMKELGGAALVGIGATVTLGESLNESYRQALLGLHLGRRASKKVVFFSSVHTEKSVGVLEIMRLLEKLKRLVESASFANLEVVLDGFLNQVLTLSIHNPEEIRWHLQYGLIQMKEAVEKRLFAGKEEASGLHEKLLLALEKAGTTQEMILAFKDAFEKLLFFAQGGGALTTAVSMERIRDYLDEHFREPLRAEKLAKLVNISVATLSRHFKKTTGVGFETYLQNSRIDEAKRLLKNGSLPIFQVAQSCGFKSASHFTRFFRQKIGCSPEEFRKKSH
jgi:AraC-like DNA-binding protein